jgi:TolA-binding protein
MTIKRIVSTTTVLLALAAPAIAQEKEATASAEASAQANEPDRAAAAAERADAVRQRAAERAAAQANAAAERAAARGAGRGVGNGAGNGPGPGNFKFTMPIVDPDALYDQARTAIENNQFDLAVREFNRLTEQVKNYSRADAALYWKAYGQSKLTLDDDALRTITELAKQFATSPWVRDAKALAVEIQQAAGQPVSAELQNDEELKLLALRGVMQTDPDKGVQVIEKMLAGGATPRVRDRALFVLAQSRSPKAHDIIASTAKNNTNPDMQIRAIRYLGMMRTSDYDDLLAGIYRSSADASVKRSILQSYFQNGNADKLGELARNEKDADLRRTAIRNLGMMNRPGTSETLVAIYRSDSSADIRREVINSLFIHHDAKALVDLARAEKDPSLKREIVSKLSVMKAPEATDYMLELLK